MSALAGAPEPANTVVLVPAGGMHAAASRQQAAARERPGIRLAAFSALALYGTLRWGSLLSPDPLWRLLGLLGVAVLVVAAAQRMETHRRLGLAVLAFAAAIVVLALAGIPVRWVTHVRVSVTANAIGNGLTALPRALVPYDGVNQWLRMVIVLGAGVLLLDASLILALAPRALSDLRRVAVALPLVALAVVPSTLVRPSVPYLHGLILFILVAAFIWGERLRRGEAAMAALLATVAGVAGMIAAPRLDRHSPWLNYEALAGDLAPAHPEAFDWRQGYGPLHWPRTGREVLDVQARQPDYWKAEDLDVFDGRGWVNASVNAPDVQFAVDRTNLVRWTQSLHVTLRAMKTDNVIAAGAANPPQHIPGSLVAGPSEGTWLVPGELGPGDSYTVSSYDPRPSAGELEAAGTDYPEVLLPAYLTLYVPADPAPPQTPASVPQQPKVPSFPAPATVPIAPFGSTIAATYSPSTADPGVIIEHSPYARAWNLAQRMRRSAPTPYDYAMRVERYLQHGFRYEEGPPPSAYPLESFLFKTKAGYCQQFAGAMALLLRMGGVPARVAAGFTTGSYSPSAHQWVVADTNAHAWVEAWFPHYGWVRFDPTPAAAPARGGHIPLPAIKNPGGDAAGAASPSAHGLGTTTAPAATTRGAHGGGSSIPLIGALVIAFLLLVLLARATIRLRQPDGERMLAELERALRRCGRPVGPETTLAALEQRFGISDNAAGYIRAIRLERFAGAGGRPSRRQRRALRAQLRAGLGLIGFARALWAIPPELHVWRLVSRRPATGIH
jgi:protein-glutamine gamma-glutamyltransferase